MQDTVLCKKQRSKTFVFPTTVEKQKNQSGFRVLKVARALLATWREDVELMAFVRKYENIKRGRRKIGIRINRAVSSFILGFPYYWQMTIKKYTDFFMASILFVVFAPLMGLVAVLVKLTSRGPVIYKQVRVGQHGQNFVIYKFRTMYADAEKESGPMWARNNDPRITPLGYFLRKSHLDELPQLFNVLKGEMSIVGPRPERPYFVTQLKKTIPQYEERLRVKPGITGLAQVRHKYDETIEDVKRKIKYDIVYIRKMCLVLDLRVLFWTIAVVFTGKGAR